MSDEHDLASLARRIIGSSLYLVLATSDANGTPWLSPVYYAHDSFRAFFWVSSPDAEHSRNLEGRPETSAVIFDSGAPIAAGQAVYMRGRAGEVRASELAEGIGIFSSRSLAHGASAWDVDEVGPGARLRLYRADIASWWVLDPTADADLRVAVDPSAP